jgi:ComF family protein
MKNKPAFDKLRAVAIYSGPIKKAIQANKYQKDISVGIELSKLIAVYIRNENFDLGEIVPIPLGVKRLKERGYNQVSSFAFPLSLNLGVRYSPKSLVRIRETDPQVGLSAVDRHINVKNAFKADPSIVFNKNILLLDDVATTGATLSSAAKALKEAKANKVFAVTIARALSHY